MGLFDKFRNTIVAIIIVTMGISLSSCSYNPPEGYTKEHHTYQDVEEFARSIDTNAVVEEKSSEIEDEYGNVYLVWDAVIRGVDCHVASIPKSVFNEGLASGEFARTYYRMDTDYDFLMMEKILVDKHLNSNWNLIDEVGYRYHHDTVYVEKSFDEYRKLNDDELEQVWEEAQSIDKEFEAIAFSKQVVFSIPAPAESWNYNGEQKPFVKKNSELLFEGISKDKKQQFFEEYKESWALLESGLPVYE